MRFVYFFLYLEIEPFDYMLCSLNRDFVESLVFQLFLILFECVEFLNNFSYGDEKIMCDCNYDFDNSEKI